MSNGMLAFNNTMKIKDTPFSFPYVQVCTLVTPTLTLIPTPALALTLTVLLPLRPDLYLSRLGLGLGSVP